MTTFSKNRYDLLDDEETEVEQVAEPTKTAAPVEGKKVDKSRAQKGEARIKHEYPQRGGIKTVSSTRVEGEEGRGMLKVL
ncbi:hypothetical protein BC937DRAFT_86269 [Endogone sp. FLAS-F59071]|nr:hypothetical protein BC937DRAFT_86269 [Endogone sp. FLAS-F59071]|eukprot:RUS13147.1 hypothetical protein BC937DRAFT_86269 [Endogone sp. FLAS-F59071]